MSGDTCVLRLSLKQCLMICMHDSKDIDILCIYIYIYIYIYIMSTRCNHQPWYSPGFSVVVTDGDENR